MVGVLLLLSCVAIGLGCRRIAKSGALPLPRPEYRARCVGYPRLSSRLSGVHNSGARDVCSMFARHRCHRLLSSGVETYRTRCVVNVRTSSLSSLVVLGVEPYRAQCVASVIASSLVAVGDPTLLLLPLPPCGVMVSRHRCHRLRLSGIGPFCSTIAGCVVNARTSSLMGHRL